MMNQLTFAKRSARKMGWIVLAAFLSLSFGTGCAATHRGRPFATPEEGTKALIAALKPLNTAELRSILGPESDEIVSSGDEVADRHTAEDFVDKYERQHRIVVEDDEATLVVGDDDWPMPIPLVHSGNEWRFDTDEGKDEILARRVGRNELDTIESCRAIVDAQREFAAMNGSDKTGDPIYAQKFLSDSGEHNGLYWEAKEGEPESPLGDEFVAAVAEGYGGEAASDNGLRPYHGYYFRMLTGQGPSAPGGARSYIVNGKMTGAFAVVAWPVEHGNSGIKTFLISSRGVLYQKDLGKSTEKLAEKMSAFDPDPSWEIVPETSP